MTYQEAITKVQKLLRLSESSNIHEAALAAQQAQKIMEKWQISSAMLSATDGEPDEPVEEGPSLECFGRNKANWKVQVGAALAPLYGCHVFTRRRSSTINLEIVGRASDVQTVRYFYQYLTGEIDRLCKRLGKGLGRTWGNNFRMGAIQTIKQRLQEAKEEVQQETYAEAQGDCQALIRVDTALAKLDQKLKATGRFCDENFKLKYQPFRYRPSAAGYTAGQQAAENIRLSKPGKSLGSGSKKLTG